MYSLLVIEVFEDYIVCKNISQNFIYIRTNDLDIKFEINDVIYHIEHGFCDVYRNEEMIAGLSQLRNRMFLK